MKKPSNTYVTAAGRVLTDDDVERLSDEAAATDYDLSELRVVSSEEAASHVEAGPTRANMPAGVDDPSGQSQS